MRNFFESPIKKRYTLPFVLFHIIVQKSNGVPECHTSILGLSHKKTQRKECKKFLFQNFYDRNELTSTACKSTVSKIN